METLQGERCCQGCAEGIRPATVGLIAAAVITIGEAAVNARTLSWRQLLGTRDATISVGGMHRCDIGSLWTDYTGNSKI